MTDLEFVQRCVKAEQAAWDEFVDKYSRLVYNYIHSILNAKGFQLAKEQHTHDIFQEIFSGLIKDNFKKLKSFQARNGCSLASWLRQVTINFTIDYLRRIKPAVSLDAEDEDGLSLKDILIDDSLAAPDLACGREMLANLKKCIQGLGSNDRYFLELHIRRGLRLEELKGILRLSRGAVDMQKARIIQRLRECFRSKGLLLDS